MTRDLRRYAQQTNLRLIIGALLILLIIGDGLIYYFYGRSAAVTGLLCLLVGLFPLLLIWGSLGLISWLVRKANQE